MFNDGGIFPELRAPPRTPPEPPAPLRNSSRSALGLGAATDCPSLPEERTRGLPPDPPTISTNREPQGPRCSLGQAAGGFCSLGEGGLGSEDVMGSHSLMDKVELVGKIFCINI